MIEFPTGYREAVDEDDYFPTIQWQVLTDVLVALRIDDKAADPVAMINFGEVIRYCLNNHSNIEGLMIVDAVDGAQWRHLAGHLRRYADLIESSLSLAKYGFPDLNPSGDAQP